ncbi:MAG: organoarsenical effux MFS transporter ArsJ [Planctomycetota bacterium]
MSDVTVDAAALPKPGADQGVDLKRYALVTAAYWGLTLTDGALRMLVLLYFHELGYSPLQLAFLFLLYESCGIITNLVGGWAGARYGLKVTLFLGLAVQVVALLMLSAVQPGWAVWLSIGYVMLAQALSGVAKDLTKMSSKSAVKLVVPGDAESALFKWVAVLTGSKNALKGVGFFLGGLLLATLGFAGALWAMAGGLALVLLGSVLMLEGDFGRAKTGVKLAHVFSKSRAINLLALARVFLFASRDVWFVVALPVFLYEVLGWGFTGIGAFMAGWVIAYGLVQASAPKLIRKAGPTHGARSAVLWGTILAVTPASIALLLYAGLNPAAVVLVGLGLFGVVFAINSALHSYLILALTDHDKVALNVGFYYMANACGRLIGTLLSGLVYLAGGLEATLWVSAAMIAVAATSVAPIGRAQPDAAKHDGHPEPLAPNPDAIKD